MIANAWSNGGNTYGIRVGPKNRDAFFDQSWTEIEVEIEGEFHRIPITGGFWNQCPEFRSPVIREWLGRHGIRDWPMRKPPHVELVPLGGNQFRLGPALSNPPQHA
ncbi:MAG TPA: hypothetical protein VLK84_31670 [Longimicrobium sp.]|nr:hypothetical protein [Longimicrobium sp.]